MLLCVGACSGNDILPSSPAERTELAAGCEDPTEHDTSPSLNMLPGRRCLFCHAEGGRAAKEERFRAGGTVFTTAQPASCGVDGAARVTVELLRRDGSVQAASNTTSRGNFHFKQELEFPLRVRFKMDGRIREKVTPVPTGDCASCHDGHMTGRLAAP